MDGMNLHYIVAYKYLRVVSTMPLLYFFMVGWLTSFLNCSLATLIAIAAWIVNTRLVGFFLSRIYLLDTLRFLNLTTQKTESHHDANYVIIGGHADCRLAPCQIAVTYGSWCILGSFNLWFPLKWELPSISGAWATHNFTYLVRGPWRQSVITKLASCQPCFRLIVCHLCFVNMS